LAFWVYKWLLPTGLESKILPLQKQQHQNLSHCFIIIMHFSKLFPYIIAFITPALADVFQVSCRFFSLKLYRETKQFQANFYSEEDMHGAIFNVGQKGIDRCVTIEGEV
jgi:hypothetical protein